MGEAHLATNWTPEQYVAWERLQPTRHEYRDGKIFDMAGATPEHNDIVANLVGELRNGLRDKPCRVRSSEQQVHIPATGLYTYPDALIVCGQPEYTDESRMTLLNPLVIFEVLSDSTESYDRGKKFRHYRSIPQLRDYVLVAQDTVWVEHYVRGPAAPGRDASAAEEWILRDTLPGGTLHLASCGVDLAVDELYRKVFTPAA